MEAVDLLPVSALQRSGSKKIRIFCQIISCVSLVIDRVFTP
jgi:hypothetical protein